MIARVLPREEWSRLKGTEAEQLWPALNPSHSRVLVVEDEGEIIATWCLFPMVHAECLWAKPDHRGVYGAAKALLSLMRQEVAQWKVNAVMTASMSPHVTKLIEKFGGEKIPGE